MISPLSLMSRTYQILEQIAMAPSEEAGSLLFFRSLLPFPKFDLLTGSKAPPDVLIRLF
jgi:hypothetical protein